MTEIDASKCGICWQDITIKRTVALQCGHTLHRTCFINLCESTLLSCPICPQRKFSSRCARDERNNKLPQIFLHGPTGELSTMRWRTMILNDSMYFIQTADHHLENIAEWLLRTSEDLKLARKAGKSAEYIRDIIDERQKLFDRYQAFVRLQQEAADMEIRIKAAATVQQVVAAIKAIAEEPTAPAEVAAAAAAAVIVVDQAADVVEQDCAAAAAAIAEEDGGSEDELCAVCFEGIRRKRAATLEPCKHTFHRTCIIRWLEQQRMDHIGKSCCICRQSVEQSVSEDVKIPMVPAIELMIDDFISGKEKPVNNPIVFIYDETEIVESIFRQLTMQLIYAVRDGRSQEYVDDIKEEMEKYKKRSLALDRFKFSNAEKEEIKRISRRRGRFSRRNHAS